MHLALAWQAPPAIKVVAKPLPNPMKPFLRSQLERYAQRLEELDFLLSREDIMIDMAQ